MGILHTSMCKLGKPQSTLKGVETHHAEREWGVRLLKEEGDQAVKWG
jgi:hypothetical protein